MENKSWLANGILHGLLNRVNTDYIYNYQHWSDMLTISGP